MNRLLEIPDPQTTTAFLSTNSHVNYQNVAYSMAERASTITYMDEKCPRLYQECSFCFAYRICKAFTIFWSSLICYFIITCKDFIINSSLLTVLNSGVDIVVGIDGETVDASYNDSISKQQ